MSALDPAIRRFIRREALVGAGINAALSLAFFLALFGAPGRPLAFAAPDRLALDFVPQAGMIALMSALVPVLASRRKLAMLTGRPPRAIGAIVRTALGWALAGVALGLVLAGLALLQPLAMLPAWPALALKLAFGAGFGAFVTASAIRPR